MEGEEEEEEVEMEGEEEVEEEGEVEEEEGGKEGVDRVGVYLGAGVKVFLPIGPFWCAFQTVVSAVSVSPATVGRPWIRAPVYVLAL